jgi:hypothetical protein
MEIGQGPNWGCSAKEKKRTIKVLASGLFPEEDPGWNIGQGECSRHIIPDLGLFGCDGLKLRHERLQQEAQ